MGKSRLLRELEQRLAERRSRRPRIRTGRCLPYGSGIVYWALGEVVRGEAGIVDSDSSDEAWAKLGAYVSDVLAEAPGAAERRARRRSAARSGWTCPRRWRRRRAPTPSACARRSSRRCGR